MKSTTAKLQVWRSDAERIDHLLHQVIYNAPADAKVSDVYELLKAAKDLAGQLEVEIRMKATQQRIANQNRAYSSGTIRNLR